MSNRTPHRDQQATYSAALRVPLDRTLSPIVGDALNDPRYHDQIIQEITAVLTRAGGASSLLQTSGCPRCSAVLVHYSHESDAVSGWRAAHMQARHGVAPARVQ